MKTLKEIRDIYKVVKKASTSPVEIVSVTDNVGEQLTLLLRKIRSEIEPFTDSFWDEALALLAGIRWHWSLSPGSPLLNQRLQEMLQSIAVQLEVLRLRGAKAEHLEAIQELIELVRCAPLSPMAEVLQEYLFDGTGMDVGLVLPRRYLAEQYRDSVSSVFPETRLLGRDDVQDTPPVEQLLFMGSPQLFGEHAWQAPRAEEQVFVVPNWIAKTGLPVSPLQNLYINPYRRVVKHSAASQLPKITEDPLSMMGFSAYTGPGETPANQDSGPLGVDEVWARQVTLADGRSTMLDVEGEQVRTLDPWAEPGQRVKLTDVEEVQTGSYLVLRVGASETDALRDLTVAHLGGDSASVLAAHSLWKSKLSTQLRRHGERWVRRKLLEFGMQTLPRVEAWCLASTFGPRADDDFALLMIWLDLSPHRFLQARSQLRSAQSIVTHAIRTDMETRLSGGDMQKLVSQGTLEIEAETEGVAGMLAGEVVAVSSELKRVRKHQLRVLETGRRLKWQE